ncbi:MAG: plastocyanin/azurin family copper-binding protein [Adhaeribacter sp.]
MLIFGRCLLILWACCCGLSAPARPLADSLITITLQAVPGMQFDLVRFQVAPGTRVKLVFSNADDMSHNLLITAPGARLEVVNAALQLEEKGPASHYIPSSPKVLWAIPVISPGQTRSITFTAPQKTGVYPYVCTYPGHGFVMYGAMYVGTEKSLPALSQDAHIPPARRQADAKAPAHHAAAGPAPAAEAAPGGHPYAPVAPYLYRLFMDDASPAAIAVRLPQDLAYCWDAAACRLRYAWKGGFVDTTLPWKGHADATARVLGTIFFRDNTAYPLRPGKAEAIPTVAYKGYRLVNRYPEFHYTLNGTDVYELIQPKADGNGLVRTFRIPGSRQTWWFDTFANDEAVKYQASAGKWEKGKLRLSAKEARSFTLTMTHYSLAFQNKKKK